MSGMIHTRHERWRDDDFPFGSIADLCAFLVEFEQITGEAVPEPPRKLQLTLGFEHGRHPDLDLDEFRAQVAEVNSFAEISDVQAASVFADPPRPGEGEEGIREPDFTAFVLLRQAELSLVVEGRSLVTVEGTFAATKTAVAKYAARKRVALEEEREQRRRAEADETMTGGIVTAGKVQVAMSSRPWWENPWIVGTGVTVIGGVILALILGSQ